MFRVLLSDCYLRHIHFTQIEVGQMGKYNAGYLFDQLWITVVPLVNNCLLRTNCLAVI